MALSTGSVRSRQGCDKCSKRGKTKFAIDIRMAFQPIVDVDKHLVFAHEALVRGPEGEGAGWVLSQVDHETRYAFDQLCRVTAIETAARLNMADRISINFMPNAVYNPENCIQTTLRTAEKCAFPLENLIFEFTEGEDISDVAHLSHIFDEYRKHGFGVAIDDFGAGFSGLGKLAELQPDLVKLDMALIRGIDRDDRRRIIVDGIVEICTRLKITVIAEGIETEEEMSTLVDHGITLLQGYYFAKASLEAAVVPDGFSPRRAAA
ncbi:MAG: EAL domain-containing protein [Pseudomonadota bacterium]